mgnify:FL=1
MQAVGIIGLGKYVPKKILNNRDLEKMVDTSREWIVTRTGIRERRLAGKNEVTSDMGIRAAGDALRNAKLKAQDIELIITILRI